MRVTLRVLLLALASIASVGNAQTKNVVLVTNNVANDTTLINFMRDYRGYTVTTGVFNDLDTNPAAVATLNAADLVFVSRNTGSGDYVNTSGTELAAWDALTTPVLLGSAHLTRNDRWRWVDSNTPQAGFNGDISAPAGTTEVHPLFADLTVDLSDLINFPPVSGIAKYEWTVGTDIPGAPASGLPPNIMGSGEVIGVRNNELFQSVILAKWQAGQVTGSGNTLGGDRVFYAMPTGLGGFHFNGVPLLENILDSLLGPIAEGDVNFDGNVDITDFNLIRDNFGDAVTTRALGDLNRDSVVDLEDYNLWVSAVDPLIAAQASWSVVPEPSSLAMVSLALLGFLAARKRRGLLSLAMLTAVTFGMAGDARAVQVWASAMDGNANDTVGTNHGTATGTPIATADRHGNPTGATLFDGSSYFSIPNTGTGGSLNGLISSAGTFSMWVRIDDVTGETGPFALGSSGGGTTQYFSLLNTIGTNDGNNNGHGWRVDLDRGNTGADHNAGRIGVKSNGLGIDGNGYAPMGTGGVWQHLAATFEVGGQLRLYVNGVLQNATPALTDPTLFTATSAWVIGTERAGSRNMIGAIDDVQLFNTALDQAGINGLAHLIPGDVNNDGVANLEDFSVIRDNFGNTDVLLRRMGDLNHDRVVDHLDFNQWKNGVSPAMAALASWTTVPEPASVALLAMGGFGVLVLQRKRATSRRVG